MKTTYGAIFAALMLTATPAWSQTIPELEPYLKGEGFIKGNAAGDGIYTDVVIGTGEDELRAGRLSLSLDGANLTDLMMEDVTIPPGADGIQGTVKRIVVENSAIPLNLDGDDQRAVFDWLLNMDADRLAIEDFEIFDNEMTFKVASLKAENVRDGFFETISLSGVTIDGVGEDGESFSGTLDDLRVNGIGAGWLIYLRMAELDGSALPESEKVFTDPEMDFLKDFMLSDHAHHMRLVGMSMQKFAIAVQGLPVFDIDAMNYDVTGYSGSLPVAANFQINGAVDLEAAGQISKDDQQSAQGIQAFRAVYGQSTVNFSAAMQQTWNEVEKVAKIENMEYVFEKLLRISVKSVFSGYEPSRLLEALEDPNDDLTVLSIMDNAEVSQTSIKITDLGVLDVGFTLAPPQVKREQIAFQAAQIAGIGVLQAMQLGIKLNGSIAEVLSGFITNGGTIEVRQSPGKAIPMAQFYKLMANPEDQAAMRSLLSTLDLEVLGAP